MSHVWDLYVEYFSSFPAFYHTYLSFDGCIGCARCITSTQKKLVTLRKVLHKTWKIHFVRDLIALCNLVEKQLFLYSNEHMHVIRCCSCWVLVSCASCHSKSFQKLGNADVLLWLLSVVTVLLWNYKQFRKGPRGV